MLTLIRNTELYAPAALGRRDILVGAGQILAINERIEIPARLGGEAVEVVDAQGLRTIPGLLDPHVHATGGGGESGPATRVPPIVLSALVESGITTCVGVLGTDGTTRSVEDLVARTLGLREEGLSAYCYTGNYQLPPLTLTGSVRRDIVFIDPIIGFGEFALSDHRSSQPTLHEMLRIASDCHVAGLISGKAGVLHLHLGDGERGLDLVRQALDTTEIPARVFYPTHVNRQPELFEEAKALAVRGCNVDVTAFPDADGGLLAEDAIEAWLEAELPLERLTCSSDGSGCLPVFDNTGTMVRMDVGRPATVAATLKTLVKRGRALEEVLPIFTANISKLLRLPRKGQLQVGSDADIVVLDDSATPLHVMAGGQWMVREHKSAIRGTFEV